MSERPFQRSKFKYPTLPIRDLKNTSIDRAPETTEIFSWAAWYLKDELEDLNRSAHTVAAVRDDLQKMINFFYVKYPDGLIKSWSREFTKNFFALLEHYKVSSKYRVRATLAAFANYLVRKHLLDDANNPIRKFDIGEQMSSFAPQSLRVITEDETVLEGEDVFSMLIQTAEVIAATLMKANQKGVSRTMPARDISILRTLKHTGLRVSEICRLRIEQIQSHRKSGGLFFTDVVCKGGKVRKEVYMRDLGIKPLYYYLRGERKEILKRTQTGSPYIFLSWRGRPLSRVDIGRILKKIALLTVDREVASGATSFEIKAHPHSFRHERAYTLLSAGLSESFVAEELGQSSTAYIQRYTKRSPEDRAERLKNI